MRRLLAPLVLLVAQPVHAEDPSPPIQLAFSVERDGVTLASGSIFPEVGVSYQETVAQAYPPPCRRGEVEHGYRSLELAITQVHHLDDFSVYFAIHNRRDLPDPEEDRCLAARSPEQDLTFHGKAPLKVGEAATLPAGDGIVVRLHRVH